MNLSQYSEHPLFAPFFSDFETASWPTLKSMSCEAVSKSEKKGAKSGCSEYWDRFVLLILKAIDKSEGLLFVEILDQLILLPASRSGFFLHEALSLLGLTLYIPAL